MSDAVPTLDTPRLVLRPLRISDAEAVQRLFPRWEIVRFLAAHVPWPYPPDGALTHIRDMALPAMAAGREWHWAIVARESPETLIGMISLFDKPDDNRGFWLDPARQGRGLMSEASAAVIRYWFETLDRPVLRVQKAAPNLRSRRVSERDGMRLTGVTERDYVSGRFPTELWELTRDEWRARNP